MRRLALALAFAIAGTALPALAQQAPDETTRAVGGEAADGKPADDKPADGKPADGKPADGAERPVAPHYALEIDAPEEIVPLIERQTLIGKWRTRREYDPEQFGALLGRMKGEVEAILQSRGYFDHEVSVQGDGRTVKVTVSAGPRATVGKLTLTVRGPAADDERVMRRVNQVWSLEEGAFFRAESWETGKRLYVDRLRQYGFLRAKIVESEARVDVQSTAVQLTVVVDSGPRIAFGPLRINGLSRYEASIVRALRPWRDEEPYDFDQMLLFQTRLRDAGWFASAYVQPDMSVLESDPSAREVPMLVEVTENPSKRWVGGVGYSTDQGARVQTGLLHRNLFDRGWQLDSGVILEQLRQRAYATVTTPLDDDRRYWATGLRFDKQDVSNELTERQTVFGGRGTRSGRIETFTSLQYQVENSTIDPGAGPVTDSRKALSLGYSWNYRALDNRVDPRDGYTVSAQVSGAKSGILTDRSFARFYMRAMRFLAVDREAPTRGGVFVGLLETGYVASHSRDDIPSENLFRTGGAQSLRGYKYQSVGVRQGEAVVGGRVLMVASLEYQHPITPQYWGAVFVDAGNAVDRVADFTWLRSWGVGLRWRTPIGPLNIDVARAEAEGTWRASFSVGYTF